MNPRLFHQLQDSILTPAQAYQKRLDKMPPQKEALNKRTQQEFWDNMAKYQSESEASTK